MNLSYLISEKNHRAKFSPVCDYRAPMGQEGSLQGFLDTPGVKMNQGLSDWFLGNTCLLTYFPAALSASSTLDFCVRRLKSPFAPIVWWKLLGNSAQSIVFEGSK
jgi:hypothetical protein